MYEQIYPLMQWPQIEALMYSEHDIPHQILGQRITEEGILITAYIPTAVRIIVKNIKTNKEYPMIMMEDGGYFAALIPGKRKIKYAFIVEYDNGFIAEVEDPYAFDVILQPDDIKKFNSGINYEAYRILGAHLMEVDEVRGVHFAVWAPEAIRVSVVGDFNLWDGRRHPMRRLGESGIHELFIPDLIEGEKYKYEIKIKGDTIVLKSDPYGFFSEVRPKSASIIYDIDKYSWTDDQWLAKCRKTDTNKVPMLIYEVHLGGFKRPAVSEGEYAGFYNYRELAPMIASYVKEMGYTHIELMPIMEHPLDESWGYQVTGYYAPTSRYGNPDDFMYFVDYMHNQGIGVIFDWVPAHFPRDLSGLAVFDGTCLYEHADPRQGSHPHWGTLIYNYGRPEVSNFLIANALYWVEQYHVDGIRIDAVASMLYLDYGKDDGEWVANIYGGNENLEAIEFFKHLNSIMKRRNKRAVMIAEESTAWPKITHPISEDGLGFDYKWNMGWMNDFLKYMQEDPLARSYHYGELLFSMIYAYSEKFVLVLSHDEVVHGKGSMLGKMPGTMTEKFANLRTAYGFMMAHPGKKLLFMGQEFAQLAEFSEAKSLDWGLLEVAENLQMQSYVKALNHLYQSNPAFYKFDFEPEGFEWINNISANESIVVFLRKTKIADETLLIVCNFDTVSHTNYKIGVPFIGKYKEIFNSDALVYGGSDAINPRLKQSKKSECDGRENSINITVPPLGMSVFTCTKPKKTQPSKKAPLNKSASELVERKHSVRTITTKDNK